MCLNIQISYQKIMTSLVLLIIGAALPIVWGTVHFFPIKNVVKDFGDISEDNKNILKMEWIMEGIALIFNGLFVITMVLFVPEEWAASLVYILASAMLIVMTIVTLFTGFKVNFLPYKLCVPIFLSAAILYILGGFVF